MKRILSVMSVFCIFLLLFSAKAFAAFGRCGDNLTWNLDNEGVLTISGTGDMYNYSEAEPLIPSSVVVNEIIIEDGVTSIGSYAFIRCQDVSNVTIPDSVTRIGGGAFQNCTGLTSIYIPASVSEMNAYHPPFMGCSSNMKIYCEASEAPTAWGERWNCYYDDSYHTQSYLTAFFGYSKDEYDFFASLTGEETEIVVPTGVRTICPYAFRDNANLMKVTIPDTVTMIGSCAFVGCTGLTDVYYLGTQEQALSITTETGNQRFTFATWHLFIEPPQGSSTLLLPISLQTIQSEAFANNNAENIIIPASVNTITSRAFANCRNLKMLYFEGSPTNIATDILSECDNVTVVVLQGSPVENWAKDLELTVEYHR